MSARVTVEDLVDAEQLVRVNHALAGFGADLATRTRGAANKRRAMDALMRAPTRRP